MSTGPYALSTLALAKEYLGIPAAQTGDDALLEHLIDRATEILERGLDRKMKSRTYVKELHDGAGDSHLFLRQYPVIEVHALSTGGVDDGISVQCSAVGAGAAFVTVDVAQIKLAIQGGASASSHTLALADYPALEALAAAMAALEGWTAAASPQYATRLTADLLPVDGVQALDNAVALPIVEQWAASFHVDHDTGRIYSPAGFGRGRGNVVATYTAGFAAIPADLEMAALEIVLLLYDRQTKGLADDDGSQRVPGTALRAIVDSVWHYRRKIGG